MNFQIKRLKNENNVFVQNEHKAYIVTLKDKKNKSKAFWFPAKEEVSPEDLNKIKKCGVVDAKLPMVMTLKIEKEMKELFIKDNKNNKKSRLKNNN
jgi:hypothetical protein